MKGITRKEELIMLSVLNLKNNAYLVSIADYLSQLTDKKVNLTTVFQPLNRLERRGLIVSEFGEATAVRGGRRKKIYVITEAGFQELKEHKKITDLFWKDYSKLSLP